MTETAERNATHAAVKSDIAKPRLLAYVRRVAGNAELCGVRSTSEQAPG